jgi:hypothetical protein
MAAKKPGRGAVRFQPDFGALSFADYGLTVTLGAYEASSDGILYEFDAAYRQKLNKERRQNERTFGAALRRLRLQGGLKQGDFAPPHGEDDRSDRTKRGREAARQDPSDHRPATRSQCRSD